MIYRCSPRQGSAHLLAAALGASTAKAPGCSAMRAVGGSARPRWPPARPPALMGQSLDVDLW